MSPIGLPASRREVRSPAWLSPYEGIAQLKGGDARLQFQDNGFVYDLVVNGRQVLDYGTVARQRGDNLDKVKWVPLVLFVVGAAVLGFGFAMQRQRWWPAGY